MASLKEFFAGRYRSVGGRGDAVPAGSHRVDTVPRQRVGRPRLPTPRPGQKGDPSASMDVDASNRMQGPFWDEQDFEDFEEYLLNPPDDPMIIYLREFIRGEVRSIAESKSDDEAAALLGDDDDEDEDDTDEASVSANVAGYTIPLGDKPPNRRKNQPPSWKYFAKALNAKPV